MSKKEEYKKDATKLVEDSKNDKIKDIYRVDGWKNALTGLGTTQDKSNYTYYSGYEVLDDETLAELWIGNGFAKRIVSVVADDMTREWITIDNDTDGNLLQELTELDSEKYFNMALKWKRLFGGSVIVMGIDDGREINEPVNINAIKEVHSLRVYDSTDVVITNYNFNIDPTSKEYGNIEFFTIKPPFGAPYNVHASRVLEFKGEPVPNRKKQEEWWYWGMSVLQSIWDDLKDFGASRKHIVKILYEFIIGVYKLENLSSLIAEGNEDKFRNRMNAIDLSKSIINGVLLGNTEDYQKITSSISGLPELLDRFMMFISGVTGIPVTRLFGRSPAGQNATGEADLINYYDMIKPMQRYSMLRPLQKLTNYINISKKFSNKKVEEPHIKFNPLFQLSENEEIENRKRQSEIDNMYIQNGTLSAEEIRESRFGGSSYSYETVVDENSYENEEVEVEFEEKENIKPEEENK